ncbi:MAG: DUF2851 family protein [Flavobacteriaceae bacterium]|nr:DUF2851 family protein [Flavobacteriaceae bacterium]
MLKEDFLHFIWKNKLFKTNNLISTLGEEIQILKTGNHNLNAGPDFSNALLIVANQKWAGNVEIHINASDWYVHHHEQDIAYNTIILHVVWESDMAVFDSKNNQITTLELKNYVDIVLINSYKKLFSKSKKWLNCENDITTISEFTLNNWLEKLYIERLEQKSIFILELLKQSNNNWEAVLFKLFAKSFGLKINSDAFFNLANSFDFSVLRKTSNNIEQIESLFFGQANLLEKEESDAYYLNLQNEYQFLKNKFQLTPIHTSEIKFFRLRPNNFPTIRLSQLANLYVKEKSLFSKIMYINTPHGFYNLFTVGVSEYWKNHYSFGVSSKKSNKKLTKSFIDLLLINTIIPLQFIYKRQIGNLDIDALFKMINSLSSEKNSIIDKYNNLGIKSDSALKTQALLQLNTNYCKKNNCLQCVVGSKLLNHKIC